MKKLKCEKLTKKLHCQWVSYTRKYGMRSDKVTLDRMPDLEMCFETDINVYTLYEDETVRPCHKSRELFSRKNKTRKVMNLNLYEDHLSYISKLNTHCKNSSAFYAAVCLVRVRINLSILKFVIRPRSLNFQEAISLRKKAFFKNLMNWVSVLKTGCSTTPGY